ncbi:Foxr1 [Phodopus roborovskii]|uniref:Foxr1 protein n=1 Tax=Phodopus roborovskii TaxID=109678 RepID=A0AAU9ZU85_PHORO|nr:Foxr1 [Phodopus roborovskii]
MGNECFLSFTTSNLPLSTQNLAKYRLQIVEPPKLPLEKKPNPDKDGPDIKPNLWMWVNPNIVYPPGELEVKKPKKEGLIPMLPSCHAVVKDEETSCSEEGSGAQSWPPSSSHLSHPCEQQQHIASSPSTWEEVWMSGHRAETSAAGAPLQCPRRLQQAVSPEGRRWSRPPLNYFHLIALALRNSPPCGLNVQQIYSFMRYEHNHS